MDIIEKLKLSDQNLIAHVNGAFDKNDEWYNRGGYILAIHLTLACKKFLNESITNFGKILDFGIGCNRVLGRLPSIHNSLEGVDVDEQSISYCRENYKGIYDVCSLEPPLNKPNNHYDFVWSFSVFSHLPIKSTDLWLRELHRITKENGYLILTWHGENMSKIFIHNNQNIKDEYERNGYAEVEYEPLIKSDKLLSISRSYKNIYYKNQKICELVQNYFKIIHISTADNPVEYVSVDTDRQIVNILNSINIGTMQEFFILQKS